MLICIYSITIVLFNGLVKVIPEISSDFKFIFVNEDKNIYYDLLDIKEFVIKGSKLGLFDKKYRKIYPSFGYNDEILIELSIKLKFIKNVNLEFIPKFIYIISQDFNDFYKIECLDSNTNITLQTDNTLNMEMHISGIFKNNIDNDESFLINCLLNGDTSYV